MKLPCYYQDIPSSGPPTASQAGSDPAAGCGEGGGHSSPKDTYTGLVLMQLREEKKISHICTFLAV